MLRRSLGSNVFANFIDQNYLFNSMEPKYWFLSSMVFWSEKLFPFDNNYINSRYEYSLYLRNNYIQQILNFSSNISNSWDKTKQVLPFIALVEYLTNYSEKGENIIFDIYNNILASEVSENPSVDGVIKALNNTENIWWPNFFKEFIQGNIYNVTGEEFLKNITKTIDFNDGDTLKYIDEIYNDLSAKLFRIDINSSDTKDSKSLNFKLGPSSLNLDYVKTLVFGISDNKLTFLSEGIDFSVGNLAQYDALLACVVNSGNEPPYTGSQNITMQVSTESSTWNWPM